MYHTTNCPLLKGGYYWFTGTIEKNSSSPLQVANVIVLVERDAFFHDGERHFLVNATGSWAGPITLPDKMCRTEEVWHDAVYMLLGGADPEYVKAFLKRKLG